MEKTNKTLNLGFNRYGIIGELEWSRRSDKFQGGLEDNYNVTKFVGIIKF